MWSPAEQQPRPGVEPPRRKPAEAEPTGALTPAAVLALQRGAGNHAVANVLARSTRKRPQGKKSRPQPQPQPQPADQPQAQPPPATAAPPEPSAAPKKPKSAELTKLIGEAKANRGTVKALCDQVAGYEAEATEAVTTIQGHRASTIVAENAKRDAQLTPALEAAVAAIQAQLPALGVQARSATQKLGEADKQTSIVEDTPPDPMPALKFAAHNAAIQKIRQLNREMTNVEKTASGPIGKVRAAVADAEKAVGPHLHARTFAGSPEAKDIQTQVKPALEAAQTRGIDTNRLRRLLDAVRGRVLDEQWVEREQQLVALEAETKTVMDYAKTLTDLDQQAQRLPGGTAAVERSMAALRQAMSKIPTRDEADIARQITAIRGQLRSSADREREAADARAAAEARAALGAAEAQRLDGLAADGRLSGRNQEIPELKRSDLQGQERTNVDEIFDALFPQAPRQAATVSPFGGMWGVYHGNHEANLPGPAGAGGYSEYYVRTIPPDTGAGRLRLVQHLASGRWYYSRTHYGQSGTPPFYRYKRDQ